MRKVLMLSVLGVLLLAGIAAVFLIPSAEAHGRHHKQPYICPTVSGPLQPNVCFVPPKHNH